MNVVINYSTDEEVYKLYSSDLDLLLTSSDLFRLFVMFNEVLVQSTGVELLSSPSIDYTLDSASMIQIIMSNVSLLKKIKSMPSGFQLSSDKFGGSSSLNSSKFNKSNFGKSKNGKS